MNQSITSRRMALKSGALAVACSLLAAPLRAQGRGRTYLLIHGAWFGGWVWKSTASNLRAMGHSVYAPSLTGLGDRRHLLRPGISLDTHADDIVNLVQLEDLNQVVLVGWSYGGMVVSEVLARVPERIASVVYLDAFVPERGRSLVSYSARAGSADEALQLAVQGKDLAPLSARGFGVTDPAVIDYVTTRVSPHPVMTVLQTSKALPERPNIPHTYVLASGNPNPTFRPFLKMFEDDRRAQTRILNTSHVLMLTDPASTLEILASVR